MSDSGYALITENEMLNCKDRHSLMLGFVIGFLRCIKMSKGASDGICKPLMVHTMSFLPNPLSHFMKYIGYQVPSQHRKWDDVL